MPKTAASRSRSHDYAAGCRANKGQPNPLPQLTIKGRWLKALGFTTGQKIEVITGPGQLVIRLEGGRLMTNKRKVPANWLGFYYLIG
ncbi:type I toxin-antitoxin system SymE family toxin [Pantoea sp. ARC270]|uniref:SymE family type I addiction module toxin n=1 Tax=Pantoea sp. ARC270 TaxID=2027923 RepID=UPI000DA8B2F1|nr:SymE family type I addiction module toxin [Pantoea sp. ARC270]PZL85517.1 type I toxin-antitoxin system SymE family toxin [Pantoea sp. ARC270]